MTETRQQNRTKTKQRKQRKKRIAVVTGTRAEYGVLASTLAAIKASRRLELQLVVTGIHLLRQFGHTVDQIRADGWSIDAQVKMQSGDDSEFDQSRGLGRGIEGIARFLIDADSDVVLVLGDRIEALAGALAGVTCGKIVAHVHGGDVAPGDFDDALRHSITKLAHLHFAATRDAADRIRKLGESNDRIFVVGAPGLDRLRQILDTEDIEPDASRALIVHHASGRAGQIERRTMNAILAAVEAAGLSALVVYPNTDRGHRGIIEAIEGAKKRGQKLRVARSLPRDRYLRELIQSRLLIGNSSSGIIEAATAGTAVVNIGPRQAGRLRGGRCIVDSGESRAAICAAIQKALKMRPKRGTSGPYGDGRSGAAIARMMERVELSDALRRKVITY